LFVSAFTSKINIELKPRHYSPKRPDVIVAIGFTPNFVALGFTTPDTLITGGKGEEKRRDTMMVHNLVCC
jgi:hypothetical protein